MIIVTGIGRCGTSTVARLLHEETHICMGHEFPVADKWNPQGYYECIGSFDIVKHSFEIEDDLSLFHGRHGCNRHTYGVKHPKLCDANFDIIKPESVIICTRDKEAVIKSMMTFRMEKPRKQCEEFYEKRQGYIDKILVSSLDTYIVDFTEQRSDEDVLEQLGDWRLI